MTSIVWTCLEDEVSMYRVELSEHLLHIGRSLTSYLDSVFEMKYE